MCSSFIIFEWGSNLGFTIISQFGDYPIIKYFICLKFRKSSEENSNVNSKNYCYGNSIFSYLEILTSPFFLKEEKRDFN